MPVAPPLPRLGALAASASRAATIRHATLAGLLLLLCAGCATTTSVVVLDPAERHAPTADVRILLEPPDRPHRVIAKLESRGEPGEPHTRVLEHARQRAATLGAHAIVVVETQSRYVPPVVIQDPWPPQWSWYHDRHFGYRYWFRPPPYHPFAMPDRVLPGGEAYVVRSVAIRFEGEARPADGGRMRRSGAGDEPD